MQSMSSLAPLESPEELVRRRFEEAHIPLERLETRHFPGELIVVVFTPDSHFDDAVHLANELDDLIAGGFVTVRKSGRKQHEAQQSSPTSLRDPQVSKLVDLLSSRSRTSEATPSLKYIKDLAENLDSVMAPRHHLVFGRRGVGKTALLVEAKSLLEKRGSLTFWINLQTLRGFDASTAFLEIADRLCDLPLIAHQVRAAATLSCRRAEEIKHRIARLRDGTSAATSIQRVITELHYALHVLSRETDSDIFIFADDIHYMRRSELPGLLDMLHALTRDSRVWLKAAGIRHQCRWFSDDPPTGLQSGHDAQIISLDVTLEEPEKARDFLW
jgi:AAA ATPase domain